MKSTRKKTRTTDRTNCECFSCRRGRETFVAVGVPKSYPNISIARLAFSTSKKYFTISGAENAKQRMEKNPRFQYVELWRIAP